jgi:RNA polymerase sigma-32 factor
MGTTAAQKKLFFNLRRLKGEMKAIEDGDLTPENVKTIATKLGVKEEEVTSMNRRMLGGGDASLNVQIGAEDGSTQWQDWLQDDSDSQEDILAVDQEHDARMDLLRDAMADLNDRERDIFMRRRLSESPLTLEELAKVYGVSRERIRQIEARAFEKIQKAMVTAAGKTGLIEAE